MYGAPAAAEICLMPHREGMTRARALDLAFRFKMLRRYPDGEYGRTVCCGVHRSFFERLDVNKRER